MLNENEIIIETTDLVLAKELLTKQFNGINIVQYCTKTLNIDKERIIKFIVAFASSMAITAFGVWLQKHISKDSPNQTTINEYRINNVTNIKIFIEQELKKKQNESNNK